ncbi:helix-turn-helix transcriptional regulator [Pararhizobium sp.]|uniref:helix-turn-helix transcriptional regulator n=1 Tax=Pararhizobium sp. TaxID=1977563 RepID=UPI003FA77BA8
MRSFPGVANIIYIDAIILPTAMHIYRLHHTFGGDLEQMYRRKLFHRIDPVLKLALGGIRPIEWSVARKRHPESEPLFDALKMRGIPVEGIAFPLVGRGRRSAMLSVNLDVTHERWPSYRRDHLRDFQHLASLFHAAQVESDVNELAADTLIVNLSYREIQVLAWAAAGKSYWETARILGISERTVRYFMTNARAKLDVVSTTQAVAQALRRNLIPYF